MRIARTLIELLGGVATIILIVIIIHVLQEGQEPCAEYDQYILAYTECMMDYRCYFRVEDRLEYQLSKRRYAMYCVQGGGKVEEVHA